MKVALAFVNCGIDELKALLDGGTLTVYSVARPFTPDSPVTRSGVLATFTFASPAFDPEFRRVRTPGFRRQPRQCEQRWDAWICAGLQGRRNCGRGFLGRLRRS